MKEDNSTRQLLTIFQVNKVNIKIEYQGHKYNAEIEKMSNTSISLFYKGSIPMDVDKIELIAYYDHIYYAVCEVISITNSIIILSLPEEIRKRIKRKYNRIKDPSKAKTSLIIRENNSPMPPMISNVIKRHSSLGKLYKQLFDKEYDLNQIIKEGVKSLEQIGKILYFTLYNKENIKHNTISSIINKTKKAIYITDVKNKETYLKDYKDEYFTSLLPYIKILKEHNHDNKYISRTLSELINTYLLNLKSFICAPIIILEKTEGYIAIGTRDYKLYKNELYFLITVCYIFAQAIYKKNISNINHKTIKTYFPVVDLGAGGLSLKIEDQEIKNYLKEGTNIKITLELSEDNDKVIKIPSEIIRIEPEKDNFVIKFTEITKNNKDNIEQYVKRELLFSKTAI